MGEANFDSESIVTIIEDELTLLIISSIHTLKRKKICGRLKKVFNLVKESLEFEISSDVFTPLKHYILSFKMNQLSSIHLKIVNVYHYQKQIFRKLQLKRKISRNNFINLKLTF